jgi:hypothetical protein
MALLAQNYYLHTPVYTCNDRIQFGVLVEPHKTNDSSRFPNKMLRPEGRAELSSSFYIMQ